MLRALLLTLLALLLFGGGSASADMLDAPWVGGGPGTVTNVSNGISGDPRFDYSINAASGSWAYYATAKTTRTLPVAYESSGFYSWFQVRTKLERFVVRNGVEVLTETLKQEGPTNCCSAPSGGFNYTGTSTFNLTAGDLYGFRMSGSNNTGGPVMNGSIKVWEVDASAPVVTHEVTGTKAAGDFYTGPVKIKWGVAENDSRISAKTGCDETTVTEDTAGRTFTCSVTSRGGTTKDSVTIKHDDVAPALNVPTVIVKQADAADGATVTYDTSATDAIDPSPVVDCTPASGSRFALGTTTVTCTASDAAGHTTTKTFDAAVFPGAAPAPNVNPAPGANTTGAAGLKPINATLAFRFTISKATTRLIQLKVKNLPKGATVTVTCKGPSCPKKLKGSGYTMKSKGSALSLSTLVKSNLKSGTTLNIAISSAGAITTIKSLAVRKGKAPVVNTCTASGTQPVSC